MKATGIVRRMDELGRVVIPKEIRKTLRIKEGDPLEIFTEKEQLLLQKYSPLSKLENFAESLADSLYGISGASALVCDTDVVLAAKGSAFKDACKKTVSDEIANVMNDRKVFVGNDDKKIKPYDGCAMLGGVIVAPIVFAGDVIGAVAVAGGNDRLSETVVELVRFSADFIARQFV